MTFSDDELRQLKKTLAEDRSRNPMPQQSWDALFNRLDLAENAATNMCRCWGKCFCGQNDAYENWKKAAKK